MNDMDAIVVNNTRIIIVKYNNVYTVECTDRYGKRIRETTEFSLPKAKKIMLEWVSTLKANGKSNY